MWRSGDGSQYYAALRSGWYFLFNVELVRGRFVREQKRGKMDLWNKETRVPFPPSPYIPCKEAKHFLLLRNRPPMRCVTTMDERWAKRCDASVRLPKTGIRTPDEVSLLQTVIAECSSDAGFEWGGAKITNKIRLNRKDVYSLIAHSPASPLKRIKRQRRRRIPIWYSSISLISHLRH